VFLCKGDEMNGETQISTEQAREVKSFVRGLGIDLVGVADLGRLAGMPVGIAGIESGFPLKYRYAVVLGAQLGKLGMDAPASAVNLYLEKAALAVTAYFEKRGERTLTVHPDDEFDPVNRVGLLSLKVLAKGAGLGWQGRSLLIVSPEYGPVHRWIAVLTDTDLRADEPVANQCGDCTLCVDRCPSAALKFVPFADRPQRREDVLDIRACKGDDSCRVCLVVCPWLKQPSG
jgi:epoxyqueuosine reductase